MNPVVITDIDSEKIEELKAMLTGASNFRRKDLIKKYVGGVCLGCFEVPTKLVTWDISDPDMTAKLLERYCDKCFERNKVLLTATNGKDETLAVREKKYQKGA